MGSVACDGPAVRPRWKTAVKAATHRGSNFVFASELMIRTTYSGSAAAWYGRFVVMASNVSATMMMRGMSGICVALEPVRIAAAVERFVVQFDARDHVTQLFDRPQDRWRPWSCASS